MTRVAPLALALALAACATHTDPVTGESYYSPIGSDFESQDKFIREAFLTERMIPADGGLLPEPVILGACIQVLEQVARAVPEEHRRGFRYRFLLTASPDVNAYTYGGGRLHCHLGLVARCRDAAEFAGVMAHEIGHNSHDHVGKQLGRTTRTQRIFGLGGIGLPGQRLGQAIGGLVAAPFLVQHTREEERESDDLAVDYTRAAGLDPDGIARFFEAMERDFGKGERGFFRTHPYPANRVKQIRGRIGAAGGVPAGAVRSTPEFDRALERAREILPYYEALQTAIEGTDAKALAEAADKGIAALPHHPSFHFWRGVAHEGAGERAKAVAELRVAQRLDNTNVVIPLVASFVELAAENWPEAEASATRTIALLPVLSSFLVRGTARLKQGKKQEAFDDWNVVLANLPSRDRKDLYQKLREQAPDYEYKG